MKRVLSLFLTITVLASFSSAYTFDGQFNNPLFYDWGSTNKPFKYHDIEFYPWAHQDLTNISLQLTYGSDKSLWPTYGPRGNARNISNVLGTRHRDQIDDVFDNNMLFVIFSQFLTHDLELIREYPHDMTNFPLNTVIEDVCDYSCIESNDRAFVHPYRCNDDDPLLVVRQKMSVDMNDQHDYPDFKAINRATSFLDLDGVYGRTSEINRRLREGKGGKMKVIDEVTYEFGYTPETMYNFTFRNILPSRAMTGVEVEPIFTVFGDPNHYFTTGDPRVNQNMGLTLFHLLFLREHNRLCDEIMENNYLYRLMPWLFDDRIFSEARRINIAQFQKVVYEEFLPRLLGSAYDFLEEYDKYNPEVDPTVSVEFANVALRYGHFMMRNFWALDADGNVINDNKVDPLERRLIYVGTQNSLPYDMTPFGRYASAGGFENVLRGLIDTHAAPNGITIINDVRNLTANWGTVDLFTFDVMRPRQISVPNYVRLVKQWTGRDLENECDYYRESRVSDEDPLECFEMVSRDFAVELKDLYKKLRNIDAIVGIQLAEKYEGSILDPTSIQIFIDQFTRIRDGDRFFYLGDKELKKAVKKVGLKDLFERNFNITLFDSDVFNVYQFKK